MLTYKAIKMVGGSGGRIHKGIVSLIFADIFIKNSYKINFYFQIKYFDNLRSRFF